MAVTLSFCFRVLNWRIGAEAVVCDAEADEYQNSRFLYLGRGD